MSRGVTARIAGVEFDGIDASSIPAITVTSIKGWDDGVPMRREQTDRPASHGQFRAPGYLGGRVITLEGEIYSTTIKEQEKLTEQIIGLLADGRYSRLTVKKGTATKWADVGRLGTPEVDVVRLGHLARYQLQLWAPDPRRFADAAPVGPGSSLALAATGNFATTPYFTVTGSGGGYTIAAGAGRQYVVASGPVSGQPDEIDFNTGWLRRNGALLFGQVSRMQTWDIPAGETLTHTITPASGTATMTALALPTYA